MCPTCETKLRNPCLGRRLQLYAMSKLTKISAWNSGILAIIAFALPASGLRADEVTITITPSDIVTAEFDGTFFSVNSLYSIDTMLGQTNVPLTLENQYVVSTDGLLSPSAAQGPYPQAYTPSVVPGVFDSIGSYFSFVEQPTGFNLFLDAANRYPAPGATMYSNGVAFDIGLVDSGSKSVDVLIDDERTAITNVPDGTPAVLALALGLCAVLGVGSLRRRTCAI
jgi:hypothetical protein